jgi:transglutaminase-like putative cysteine protease
MKDVKCIYQVVHRLTFLRFFFYFTTVFISGFVHAQSINIGPVPSWVKPISFSESMNDTTSSSGGYYDLLSNDQYNLTTEESFHHYAQLITSEKGLESVSAIIQNFDPSYQKITFHSVRVLRKGRLMDQLKKDKFQVIRREESLDRAIYDGSLSAIFNFEDLEVGDIVEYSLSYRGYNPAFDKYSRSFYFNYGVPVAKIFARVVVEKDRKFALRNFNQPPKETLVINGNQKEYSWEVANVKAQLFDEGYPGWYEPLNWVDFSEYASWAEVAQWNTKLFSSAFVSTPAIAKQIELFKKGKSLDEAVNMCIRFVQDEVRYLSFSDGIHGYKPHATSLIFDQRFGDCKDKSVLLALMLKGLGVKSDPVLVHSSTGKLISEGLPSSRKFNHCIVQFQLHDSTYWIDPTLSLQRGPLKKRFTPNYGYGLVLNMETTSLAAIPYDPKDSYISIKEKFLVDKVGTTATLSVDIDYGGDEANTIRDYFLSTSIDEVTKSYLNFYANDYPNIKAEHNVSFDDNEVGNIFTSQEKYFISSFWQYDSIQGKHSVNIYPRTLANYFPKPSTKIRTMPYAIAYPRNVDYKIEVKLPEAWSVSKSAKAIETSGFQYKSSANYSDSVVTLIYSLRIKKQFLEASEISDHVQKVDDAINDLSIDLTYSENKDTKNNINYPFILIMIGVSVLLFFGLKICYEYDPVPSQSPESHASIGGWLVLPAIALCIAPLRLLYFIYDTGFFNYTNWLMISDTSYAGYNPQLGGLVLVELIINFGLCVYGILVVILFFKRRSNVPQLASFFYAGSLLFLVCDALVAQVLNLSGFDRESITSIVRGAVGSAIWIPYFLTSYRSKGTFTVRF